MSDDDKLFAEEMAGVKPLQKPARVALKKAAVDAPSFAARREAAQAKPGVKNFLADNDVPLLDPYYMVDFRREGVQHGVYRKLKQARYEAEARLDLHKMSVARARQQVFEFIRDAMSMDLRSLIIVHGRGNHSGVALLKSHVAHWLPQIDDVQAFCSAQPQHGGAGAVYVLLRKSERKKQENRDRLTRGRSV
ncbi:MULTISPECIES: DNA endonuclease SmrA [Spongiibacter]|jgi:DNA-nicking Smr family endonuclease|uniref:DNA endonuclease SmrA n=1 Tax=Spongiibacter TaxID=630749 RepID=UPI001961A1C9|nr:MULTISPECIES: DNA endonuclease SmrA [Spongiibacter]MBM7424726.1 DNA-nicking Smr family endonuclease [Spongiibacter marinus]MEE2654025.1 DNA endonuclease SmrA [Pseudomonadota bacterium]|tara:strand:- start:13266 stop:13841 length:576 start_codon:yes stop_codon:yes gene_type:complete